MCSMEQDHDQPTDRRHLGRRDPQASTDGGRNTSIWLSHRQLGWLEAQADKDNISVSKVIRRCIEQAGAPPFAEPD